MEGGVGNIVLLGKKYSEEPRILVIFLGVFWRLLDGLWLICSLILTSGRGMEKAFGRIRLFVNFIVLPLVKEEVPGRVQRILNLNSEHSSTNSASATYYL